jgi:hypothetical protein
MIWDSAHDLGFRNLNHCCGVAVSCGEDALFQSVNLAEDWDNGSAHSAAGLAAI